MTWRHRLRFRRPISLASTPTGAPPTTSPSVRSCASNTASASSSHHAAQLSPREPPASARGQAHPRTRSGAASPLDRVELSPARGERIGRCLEAPFAITAILAPPPPCQGRPTPKGQYLPEFGIGRRAGDSAPASSTLAPGEAEEPRRSAPLRLLVVRDSGRRQIPSAPDVRVGWDGGGRPGERARDRLRPRWQGTRRWCSCTASLRTVACGGRSSPPCATSSRSSPGQAGAGRSSDAPADFGVQ
jgi:hypothetical protein